MGDSSASTVVFFCENLPGWLLSVPASSIWMKYERRQVEIRRLIMLLLSETLLLTFVWIWIISLMTDIFALSFLSPPLLCRLRMHAQQIGFEGDKAFNNSRFSSCQIKLEADFKESHTHIPQARTSNSWRFLSIYVIKRNSDFSKTVNFHL